MHPTKIFWGLTLSATTFGGVVIFKDLMGPRYLGGEKMEEMTAIITGPTSGIGKELAGEFARKGARLILASRDMKKCAQIREDLMWNKSNSNIVCRECDLASLDSIRKFAHVINSTEKRIDILVNNAGTMPLERQVTKDGFELNLGTNYLGHFLVTMLLLDKLKSSQPSRIINTTDIAYSKAKINFDDLGIEQKFDSQEAYLQSKLALVLFTKELARRLEGTKVTCNAVYPGITNTLITRDTSFYKSYFSQIVLKPFLFLFLKRPIQGAQNTIYASLSEELMGVSGKFISNLTYDDPLEIEEESVVTQRLWAISENWTGLT